MDILTELLLFVLGFCIVMLEIQLAEKKLEKKNLQQTECVQKGIISRKMKKIAIAVTGGIILLLVRYKTESILQTGIAFLFFALLTLVAWIDLDTMEIPNELVLILAVLGVLSYPFFLKITIFSRLIGFFSVSLPLFLVTIIVPDGFGGGDIKLMAACGIFLGWKLTLLSFAFAVLTGGIYGIWLLVGKKTDRKAHFAFGPFLCVGMVMAFLWGQEIVNWYISLLTI